MGFGGPGAGEVGGCGCEGLGGGEGEEEEGEEGEHVGEMVEMLGGWRLVFVELVRRASASIDGQSGARPVLLCIRVWFVQRRLRLGDRKRG